MNNSYYKKADIKVGFFIKLSVSRNWFSDRGRHYKSRV